MLELAEPIPILATLVVRQPLRRRPARCLRQGPRPQLLPHLRPRLSRATTSAITSVREFAGRRSIAMSSRSRKPRMPLYHLIGALDPLEERDVANAVNDGLPETLPEWIRADGLTHLKIKLNGDDLDWDVERVVRVDRVAAADPAAARRQQLVLFARFQRALCQRRLPAGIPGQVKEQDAGRVRAHPVHRAADGPRPEGQPEQRHARGAPSCGRWSSTNRWSTWKACCWPARWATPGRP